MKFNPVKYFSTLVVFALALLAGWWMWNYYMQAPWTRDGKVRAELVDITTDMSGQIVQLAVRNNQFVHKKNDVWAISNRPNCAIFSPVPPRR